MSNNLRNTNDLDICLVCIGIVVFFVATLLLGQFKQQKATNLWDSPKNLSNCGNEKPRPGWSLYTLTST